MECIVSPGFADPGPLNLLGIKLNALNVDKSSDIEIQRKLCPYKIYVEGRRIANSRSIHLYHDRTSCHSFKDALSGKLSKATYRLSHSLIESHRQALREVRDGIK